MDRFVWATYCDDIRYEIGNKLSYIGVYNRDLFVPQFPFTLPKFCITVAVRTSFEQPFKKVLIRILKGDVPILEAPIDEKMLSQPTPLIEEGNSESKNRFLTFQASFVFSPFPIEESVRIRIRVQADDEELRGAALIIAKSPLQPTPDTKDNAAALERQR